VEKMVLYKARLLPLSAAVQQGRARWYIDVGANAYNTSMGSWFMKRYPEADLFKRVAIEANDDFRPTYDSTSVEFLQYAASTRNATVQFSKDTASSGTLGGHMSAPTDGHGQHAAGAVRTLDLSDFLIRWVTRADFVVVKLDVEEAEYDILPHLIQTGAHRLIDEIFIEVHTDINSCCKPPNDAGRHRSDAVELIQQLRAAGVYAHEWF